MKEPSTTVVVQGFIDNLGSTDSPPSEPVVRAMLGQCVRRLQQLCGRFLHHRYPRLTQAPSYLETDDVVAAVVARLLKALRKHKPGTAQQFFALANQHIRWELNDLARRIDQQGGAPTAITGEAEAPRQVGDATTSCEPDSSGGLLSQILNAIGELPDDERRVFELVRVQGMTHPEAAALLGIAEKTVQRRLRRSVMLLAAALREVVPWAAVVSGKGGSNVGRKGAK